MSVVGFDVGNDTSCVALARKRGIDVIMNKESKRETPSVVSFGDKMRFLGTDGYAKISMNPKNTVNQLKRLLGKKYDDPYVQTDIAKMPFKITKADDGGLLVHVMYCNEQQAFTPEQLMAMVLVDQKKIAESEQGTIVTDCVVSVPTYYTEAERYAMLNATQIAGVNCLRLMNETTAAALAYGIYKTDLPETEPVHVAFVDIGHTAMQVSIVAFKKGQLQVKSHAWDRNLGGRDFDEVLFEHFCKEFMEKNKLDVKSNAKACFKLRLQLEKMKKVLSANPEAPLNIECLMEDQDVRGKMTRDVFEELAQDVLKRVLAPCAKALEDSQLKAEDISSVEILGSGTRVPAVFKIIEDFFGKTPSRTMHAKECVSRGCALQCAMLSPIFRVREFEVLDMNPFPIALTWERDGASTTQVLFPRGNPLPSLKMLTFTRSQPFTVTAHYTDEADIPPSFSKALGTYTVGPFNVPAGATEAKLKVKVRLNLHGLVSVESVQSIEEEEYEEPVAPATPKPAEAPAPAADGDTKMEDADAAKDEAAPAAEAAPEAAAAAEAPAPMEAEPVKMEKKKRVKKVEVPFSVEGVAGYSKKELDGYFEKEVAMQGADRLQEETYEKKNALEAYVCDLRNRLYDQLAPYIREADRETLSQQLTAAEDWLYDEGEDCVKSVYVAKLEELKKLGSPVETRYVEDQTRGPVVRQLREACTNYLNLVGPDAPAKYAHLTTEDREQVAKEAHAALAWLAEKESMQAQLSRQEDPALLTADVVKKRDAVDRACKPIVNKPPPPPPKPAAEEPKPAAEEPAKEAPAPEAAEGEEQMETDAPAEAKEGEAMETE